MALAGACSTGRLEIRTESTKSTINVELATTSLAKQIGLMYRDNLAINSGMLFVYDSPKNVKFWMKNTSIPLDIAFADESGVVRKIIYNTEPFSLKLIEGGNEIKYVLEVNAGFAKQINLFEGSEFRSAVIGPTAAWAC